MELTKRTSSLGIRAVGILISLLALLIVVRSVDVSASADQLRRANPVPLALCLVIISVQVSLRSARWRMLLPRPRDGHGIALVRILPALLVGYLGNAVLPARLGEPVRAYLVARREQLGALEVFGSVVLERIVDTASLAVVAALAAYAVGAPDWVLRATTIVAVLGCCGTALLALVGPNRIVRWAEHVAGRTPRSVRLAPMLERLSSFANGIERPARSWALLLAAMTSAICWMLDASTFWLVASSLGISMSPAAAMLVAGVTVLGTALPSAPGYVGTFELAAAATAQTLGVAAAPALALAVLAHAITLLPLAVGGAVSLVAMDVRLGRLARDAEVAEGAAAVAMDVRQ